MRALHVGIAAIVLCVVVFVAAQGRPARTDWPLNEPRRLYSPEAAGHWALALTDIAQREVRRGNVPAAIEAMQMAANIMAQERNTNFELWDNLAELYCLQARRDRDSKRAAAARANGLALIREFRCAAKYYEQNTPNACFSEGGSLANTDMTPLCYSVMCTQRPRIADETGDDVTRAERDSIERMQQPLEIDYSYYHYFRKDAANLSAIERGCQPAPRTGRAK
jgi:hypothetical protein